jgi:phosphoketolase
VTLSSTSVTNDLRLVDAYWRAANYRVPGLTERSAHLRQEMVDARLRYRAWTREHGEDHPDVRDWT